jgi:hypothetical protein
LNTFSFRTHIDNFFGFDRLLRVLVGRDKQISLYGPTGFIDRVHYKLQAYLWNLVDREPGDLTFVVTESSCWAASFHQRGCQSSRRQLKSSHIIASLAIVPFDP